MRILFDPPLQRVHVKLVGLPAGTHGSAPWRRSGKSAVEIYRRPEPTAADFTLNGSSGSKRQFSFFGSGRSNRKRRLPLHQTASGRIGAEYQLLLSDETTVGSG